MAGEVSYPDAQGGQDGRVDFLFAGTDTDNFTEGRWLTVALYFTDTGTNPVTDLLWAVGYALPSNPPTGTTPP